MMGGHSAPRAPTEEETEMVLSMKEAIEERAGRKLHHFEIVHLTSQVVAGTNFWVKIKADSHHGQEHEYIHVKIFRPLPHTHQPPQITEFTMNVAVDAPFF